MGDGWDVARLAATAAILGGLWKKRATGIDCRFVRRAMVMACLAGGPKANEGVQRASPLAVLAHGDEAAQGPHGQNKSSVRCSLSV